MEVWVIRHGQTMDNFTRILAGHQPGKLSKLGVTQAQKTGKALQQEIFHGAYVSDLDRTKKTFENIFVSLKRCKNMKVFFESLLREKSGGDLEGQSIDLPKKLAFEENLDIRLFRPKNGECWNDVFERAKNFLFILIERHVKKYMNLEPLGKGYVGPKEEKLIIEKLKISEKKINPEEEEKIAINPEKINTKFVNAEIFNGKNIVKTTDDVIKRKLSDNLHKKAAPIEYKKKSSLIEEKTKEDDKNTRKILVISHGGFIMELFNVVNFLMNKEPPVYKNSAQNCSINVLNIYCKNTKGRCCEKCPENNDCVQIDIVRRNDIKHLI